MSQERRWIPTEREIEGLLMVIKWLLTIGTLAIMGCGADSVQYPSAPTISIKKTGWMIDYIQGYDSSGIKTEKFPLHHLKCRLEAEELLPYDIEVSIEITSRAERDDGSIDEDSREHTIKMKAGRAVIGFIGDSVSEILWTSLTLSISIVPWDGSGDAPYNVGSPHTLHESWRKP